VLQERELVDPLPGTHANTNAAAMNADASRRSVRVDPHAGDAHTSNGCVNLKVLPPGIENSVNISPSESRNIHGTIPFSP
jgi:hypothetical protein